MSTTLVIGATGKVGREVVAQLLANGEEVRAATRNPAAAKLPRGASPVQRKRPGEIRELRLHNGAVYRWNRPCYGIANRKPHLRRESPLGPRSGTRRRTGLYGSVWSNTFSREVDNTTRVIDVEHTPGIATD